MWNLRLWNRFLITLIQNNPKFTKKQFYILRFIMLLHMLSITIPPDSIEKLPWHYTKFNILANFLGAVSRLNYFIGLLSSSSNALFIFIVILALLMILELSILLKLHKTMSKWDNSIVDVSKLINKNILRLEGTARFLILELCYIPSLLFIRDYLSGSLFTSETLILFVIWVVVFWTMELINIVFLRTLDWTRSNNDLISDVKYLLIKKIGLAGVVMSTYALQYDSSPYHYSIIRILYGIANIKVFYQIQPYADIRCNFAECVEALCILVSGVIFVLVELIDVNESEYLATTLSFLMSMPLLAIASYDLLNKHRTTLLSSTSSLQRNEFFLHLYTQSSYSIQNNSLEIPEDTESIIKDSIICHKHDSWLLLWLFEFFINMRYYIGANIILSNLTDYGDRFGSGIYIIYFKDKLQKAMHDYSSLEWEAHSYMRLKHNFEMLCEEDSLCCEYYWKIYHALGKGLQVSNDLSQLLIRFNDQTEKTKLYYRTLLKDYSKNSELLEFYAGFLETVCCSKKAGDIHMSAKKYKEDERKLSEVREDALNFFNRNYLKVSISLEPTEIGKIEWANKSEILGYDDKLLRHTQFVDLVPCGLKERFYEFVNRSKNLFEPAEMSYSTYKSYLYGANYSLKAVHIKFNLTHRNDNKLELLANIKFDPNGSEVAFLDSEGRRILSMVRI